MSDEFFAQCQKTAMAYYDVGTVFGEKANEYSRKTAAADILADEYKEIEADKFLKFYSLYQDISMTWFRASAWTGIDCTSQKK